MQLDPAIDTLDELQGSIAGAGAREYHATTAMMRPRCAINLPSIDVAQIEGCTKRDVRLQREQLLPQLQVKQTTSANLSPTSTRHGVQCMLPSMYERQYALRGERDQREDYPA